MQLRIRKPNEPDRLHEWDERSVDANNATLEAMANLIKFGGSNNEGEVMQVDLVQNDGQTIIRTLLQHDKMKMISSANRIQDFQKDKIAALEEEVANLRKLNEVQNKTTKQKVNA